MSKRRPERFWLYRRPDVGFYSACWYDQTARRVRRQALGTADQIEAQERFVEWLNKHARPDRARPDQYTLAELLQHYYTDHGSKARSAQAIDLALGYWLAFFPADTTIRDLSYTRLQEFTSWLTRRNDGTLSPGYILKILSTGRAAMNYAHTCQRVEWVPKIPMPSAPPKRRAPALLLEDVAALINASAPHLRRYCLVGLGTMARPEAILELTRDQLDFENRLIRLNPSGRVQNKKRRPVVPMPRNLIDLLMATEGRYVVTYKGHNVRSVKSAWRAARRRAGIRNDAALYSLRRTMATHLRTSGVAMSEIAGLMGHTDQRHSITEVYASHAPDPTGPGCLAIDAYLDQLDPLLDIRLRSVLRSIDGRQGA